MNETQYEVLNQVRDKIKCIYISATGVKVYNKQINIADIIRKHSLQISIPCAEKFDFFDFIHAKKIIEDDYNLKISKSQNSSRFKEFEEKKDESIKILEKYSIEYEKLKKFCTDTNKIKNNVKNKYAMNFYGSTKISAKNDLIAIKDEIDSIIESKIDEVILDNTINYLKKVFENHLRNALIRYQITFNPEEKTEITEEIERAIKVKLDAIASGRDIIKNIKCNLVYILDIAEETLLNNNTKKQVVDALKVINQEDLAKKVDNFINL